MPKVGVKVYRLWVVEIVQIVEVVETVKVVEVVHHRGQRSEIRDRL